MIPADQFPQFIYYELSKVLGEGGMGIVFLARDRRTDLPVAIKVMSKRLSDPDLQFRFVRENEIISSLNHRNIVRCYEITRTKEGTPSIVMEYLDGVDLRAFEGKPYPELLPLMIQTLMGMSYLKAQNIVHRDLSSNNVMVCLDKDKRLAKIVDFGIAKILSDATSGGDSGHTQMGQFLGKFAFASPELFDSPNVDWRSDIYSLGVIFYRLLTGHSPIKMTKKGSYFDWVMAHREPQAFDFPVPPNNPALPEQLKSAIRMMLAHDPNARPRSYDELIKLFDWIQMNALREGLEPDSKTVSTLPAKPPEKVGVRSGSAGASGSPASGQAAVSGTVPHRSSGASVPKGAPSGTPAPVGTPPAPPVPMPPRAVTPKPAPPPPPPPPPIPMSSSTPSRTPTPLTPGRSKPGAGGAEGSSPGTPKPIRRMSLGGGGGSVVVAGPGIGAAGTPAPAGRDAGSRTVAPAGRATTTVQSGNRARGILLAVVAALVLLGALLLVLYLLQVAGAASRQAAENSKILRSTAGERHAKNPDIERKDRTS